MKRNAFKSYIVKQLNCQDEVNMDIFKKNNVFLDISCIEKVSGSWI